MKNMKMKSILLLALVVAVLMGTVGGTVAYLVTSTGSVTNTFTPAKVDTEIAEEFANSAKTSIKIENPQSPESVDAYVRVAIVGNYVDDKTNYVIAPWNGTISLNTTDWTDGLDGYYYYKRILKVGETSTNLLNAPIPTDTTTHSGAHLEITVIHQSIQAEGLNVTSAQAAFAKADAQ